MQFKNALGRDMLNWLRKLPVHLQFGNVYFIHAGADPALPLDMQTKETCI
ncbi:hypothetical protein [Primorskyibacter sedentarius]|nr:hypothetical protein [Primorskyibacter sedentarius]